LATRHGGACRSRERLARLGEGLRRSWAVARPDAQNLKPYQLYLYQINRLHFKKKLVKYANFKDDSLKSARLGDSSWRSAKPEPEGQAVAREGFGDGYTDFGALSSPSCAHSTSLRAGFEAATQD